MPIKAGESFARAAKQLGFDLILANAGTTETEFVGATVPEFGDGFVLCLHEDVASGAADGYARVTGKPAMVNLHLGPGLAHALNNVHNAKQAGSPMVLVVGDHDHEHVDAGAPLGSDIFTLAQPFSRWVRTARSEKYVYRDLADATAASMYPRGGIATLIVPNDLFGKEIDETPEASLDLGSMGPAPAESISECAAALTSAENPLIILGGGCCDRSGIETADRIVKATGGRAVAETFPTALARGGGLPEIGKLSYPGPTVRGEMAPHDVIVLAGIPDFVPFFADKVDRSFIRETGKKVFVADVEPHGSGIAPLWGDPHATLAAIADEAGAKAFEASVVDQGSGSPVGRAIASAISDGAVVVDEAVTNGQGVFSALAGAVEHTYMTIKGGALGGGMPVALGAALADPSRQIVAIVGDGAACYANQALWNMAKLDANITVVIFNNANYDIISYELMRAGFNPPPAQAVAIEPRVNFAEIAEGFGMKGVRLDSPDEAAIAEAVSSPEPILLDVIVPSMFRQ